MICNCKVVANSTLADSSSKLRVYFCFVVVGAAGSGPPIRPSVLKFSTVPHRWYLVGDWLLLWKV